MLFRTIHLIPNLFFNEYRDLTLVHNNLHCLLMVVLVVVFKCNLPLLFFFFFLVMTRNLTKARALRTHPLVENTGYTTPTRQNNVLGNPGKVSTRNLGYLSLQLIPSFLPTRMHPDGSATTLELVSLKVSLLLLFVSEVQLNDGDW